MNILLINKFYFPKGGADQYFFDLKELLEKKGHTVIPFSAKHEKNLTTPFAKYFVSSINTQPSWNIWSNFKTVFRFWWSFEARRKIKKLLKDNEIDVVHVNGVYHQISPSILPIFKKHDIPIIMHAHDYSLVSPNYNMSLNGKVYDKICGKQYYKCLTDKCVNNSSVQSFIAVIEMYLHHKILKVYHKNIDLFISPSQFLTKKLITAGFNKNKIKTLPHFIKHSMLTDTQTNTSQQNYILYFGRLSQEKGLDILIQAMRDLPDLKLKIAGQGREEQFYHALVKKLNLKNIEFVGYQSGNNLKNLIVNSMFVINPSLAPETFGLSVLESLILKRAVLASHIGALPELLSSEFLFEPGNVDELKQKILWLTKNDNYANISKSINIREITLKHSSEAYYDKILSIYQQLKIKI